MKIEHYPIKLKDFLQSGLWRLFPVINVDKVKDIPCDYPGLMGVPITFLSKIRRNDGSSGFLIVDLIRPKIQGKALYRRLIIRNLKPDLPETIDLAEMLKREGVELEIKTTDEVK